MIAITAAFTAAFVAVHLFVGRLRFLDVLPRSRWLSFAGGIAVAYVFLHILPELAVHRRTLGAEQTVYLVALFGLAAFYGLERVVQGSRERRRATRQEDRPGAGAFWLHIVSFAAYNALVGYLLVHREETGWVALLTYGVAMAMHFVTTDFGMRQNDRRAYDARGRWVIAGAVVAGWAAGLAVALPQTAIAALFAFLAGGAILNVLKEELPEERASRFLPFAAGAVVYAALLLAAG